MRQQIQRVARVPVCGSYEKYLGLPAMVGRSRYNTFKSVKERVWEKLNNWKNLFFSQTEKEVLLKAVVQAIPTYSLSVFMLSRRICQAVSSLMAKFWWGQNRKEKKFNGGVGRRWGIQRWMKDCDLGTLKFLIRR